MRDALWASAWDLHNPNLPPSGWDAFWRSTGLGCGLSGLCSVIGQPVDADDLVLMLTISALFATMLAVRTGRPIAAILLVPALSYGLLILQHKAESIFEASIPPILAMLPELPLETPWSGLVSCAQSEQASVFRYLPGAIEQQWIRPGSWHAAGQICAIANGKHQVEAVQEWLDYAHAAASRRAVGTTARKSIAGQKHRQPPVYHPLKPPPPTSEQRIQLSFFRTPDGELQPIEPLTGIGRHPLATRVCGYRGSNAAASIYNLSYLILANQCNAQGQQRTHQTPLHACTKEESQHATRLNRERPRRVPRAPSSRPRNLYYDLGCTVYDDGTPAVETSGSGRGPSIPLFTRMYEERCVVFDQIFGWEMRTQSGWWAEVPPRMTSRINFYNVGVQEGNMTEVLISKTWARTRPRSARTLPPSDVPTSFLRHLQETATERDFVVVKLDIDGGPEQQILHAIAWNPELRKLVDEFFFEWHYDFDGLDFGWGKVRKAANTVDHALRMMQKLRHHGVRSHFWV